jgi:hypothetical protein
MVPYSNHSLIINLVLSYASHSPPFKKEIPSKYKVHDDDHHHAIYPGSHNHNDNRPAYPSQTPPSSFQQEPQTTQTSHRPSHNAVVRRRGESLRI